MSNMGCDDEYDIDGIASQNDARIIRVSIDVRDVPFDAQRTFYNHDLNEVIVHVLPGMDWTSFTVFVSPVLFATMTPEGANRRLVFWFEVLYHNFWRWFSFQYL